MKLPRGKTCLLYSPSNCVSQTRLFCVPPPSSCCIPYSLYRLSLSLSLNQLTQKHLRTFIEKGDFLISVEKWETSIRFWNRSHTVNTKGAKPGVCSLFVKKTSARDCQVREVPYPPGRGLSQPTTKMGLALFEAGVCTANTHFQHHWRLQTPQRGEGLALD